MRAMRSEGCRRRVRGFALAWVLMVILALASLGAVLTSLADFDSTVVVQEVRSLQAFNLAEAGLNWGLWHLAQDLEWAGDTLTLGEGTCEVTVEALEEDDRYRLTAVSAVGTESSTVSLEVGISRDAWPLALTAQAVFWEGQYWRGKHHKNKHKEEPELEIEKHFVIHGDVFGYGDIEIKKDAAVVGGLVYATGTVSGDGEYTVGEIGEPIPEGLELDTTYYEDLIAVAEAQPRGDWRLDHGEVYELNGQTLYVKGKVKINHESVVRGPGRIVATDKIEIDHASMVLGSVDLIAAKEIKVEHQSVVEGQGNLIFSLEKIKVEHGAVVNPETPVELDARGSTMLMTPSDDKELKISHDAEVRGIIWGGTLKIEKGGKVVGAVYGEAFHHDELDKSGEIWHDPTVADGFPPPPGVPSGSGEVTITLGHWEEGEQEEEEGGPPVQPF